MIVGLYGEQTLILWDKYRSFWIVASAILFFRLHRYLVPGFNDQLWGRASLTHFRGYPIDELFELVLLTGVSALKGFLADKPWDIPVPRCSDKYS